MLLSITFAALTLISLGLLLWQVIVAARFPLHRRTPGAMPAPAVTVLKPLKGSDAETAACLRSWFEQDYPGPVQLLFGVATADDPAGEEVRRLLARYPQQDARLVVCPEALGPNAKVSTLVQLEPHIRHDCVVVSDGDVRVPQDLLSQVVAPLQQADIGLVNCFYRLPNPVNLAMRWEAFAVNADFWSQVLQARCLKPLDFALGAVMATTRGWLSKLGGLASLLDYLADDYQLGNRIARAGGRIELCPVVAECWNAPMTWREVWVHQLRWSRTIRACQPVPYFFSILSNATVWPLLWWVACPSGQVALAAGFCLLARMRAGLVLEGKMLFRRDLNSAWLAPFKDLLSLFVWASAFLGNRVTWRGAVYRVTRGGRLAKI